jgi:serine/threonine protein kinase
LRQPIPFGKYYLLERINVGGMAEVFKAKATGVEGFERLVAVKRILPSIAEDEEFITMFVDEAKIAVQLTHANIAQIFDLGRVDGSFFIALEYVHGKDMRAIFNRARQRGELLPIPLSCYVIMKACEGLDYEHNKNDPAGTFLNLVHRDVSPQNVLVSYEGEVKIVDFGIAKVVNKSGRTQAGILKGKFGYMSPEQVQGLEIDRRSDVFGVGICLYELLTGERLFVAESDFATLEKVRAVDIMPPSTYNRRIPEELEQIVLRALARDREDRYQTALQLHDDLQAFMHTGANLFSRKELSGYMHRVFAEEIDKESARDREYAHLEPIADDEQGSGLSAFSAVAPVNAVGALSSADRYGVVASGPAPGGHSRKATLLGMPYLPQGSSEPVRAPSVPRLIPGPHSVPALPPRPSRAPSRPSGMSPATPPPLPPQQHYNAPAEHGQAQHGMEWDDEELSTQLYDKPEEVLSRLEAQPNALPPQPRAASRPPQLVQPVRPPRDFVIGANPFAAPEAGPASAAAEPLPWEHKPKSRPMLVATLAVLAIVACIVLGLMVFRQPEPGTVHLTTVPGRVSVSVDGKPLGMSTSPFVISELSADRRHTIAVSSSGYQPWSSAVELQSGQVLALPAVRLVRIETGFALDSLPNAATLLVDGQRLNQTTPARVVDMQPGEHRIRLEREGYAAWESVLQASSGTVLPLPTVTLQPLAAEPTPTTSRWHWTRRTHAEPSGATDVPAEPSASSKAPEAAQPAPTATVSESDPLPAATAPTPAPKDTAADSVSDKGTLRVNTRPWSQIFIDGKAAGTTPRMNISLSTGTHSLLFVNDEFGLRKTVEVTIEPGKVETVVLNLAD